MADKHKNWIEERRSGAAAGDADAQYELGVIFREGQLLDRDDAEAAKWIRMAAEKGHAGAQCDLGVMYTGGVGVPQDYAEALKWTRRAAEQGNVHAQFNLGGAYEAGRGVAEDPTEAEKWYRMAADEGHARAQEMLDQIVESQANDEWNLSGCLLSGFWTPVLLTAIFVAIGVNTLTDVAFFLSAIGIVVAIIAIFAIYHYFKD